MTNDVQPIEDRQTGQKHLDRLVILSDGIFAIAITLSAIELRPELVAGQSLWAAWSEPLFIYFLSFLIIGQIWLGHRRIVSHLRDIDGPGTAINLLLLSLVALMPVVIRFALTNGVRAEAIQVYSLGIAATYACMGALWGYLAFIGKLAPSVEPGEAWSWFFQSVFVAMLFVTAALFAGHLLIAAAMGVALTLLLRWLGWRRTRKAAA